MNHGTGVADLEAPTPALATDINLYDRSEGLENLVCNGALSVPGGSFFPFGWDKGIWKRNNWDVFPSGHLPPQLGFCHTWNMDWAPAAGGGKFIIGHTQLQGYDPVHHYSLDDGETWQPYAAQPGAGLAHGGGTVAAQDDQNIIHVNFNNGAAYYTTNRGASWAPLVLGGLTMPIANSEESGWAWAYFFLKKIVIASKETPGRWWLWNYGPARRDDLQGLWRSEDGPGGPWTKIFGYGVNGNTLKTPSGSSLNWSAHASFYEIPGKPNHLIATAGLDQAISAAVSTDGGVTWSNLTTNGGQSIFGAFNFAFGKGLSGSSWPVIRWAGHVDFQGHPINQFGIWETQDGFATTTRIHRYIPGGNIDGMRLVAGDMNEYGRWAYGHGGSGWTMEHIRHVFTDSRA